MDFRPKIFVFLHFQQICMKWIVFGGSHGFETYCRDETDPIELSGGSGFLADYWNWHIKYIKCIFKTFHQS